MGSSSVALSDVGSAGEERGDNREHDWHWLHCSESRGAEGGQRAASQSPLRACHLGGGKGTQYREAGARAAALRTQRRVSCRQVYAGAPQETPACRVFLLIRGPVMPMPPPKGTSGLPAASRSSWLWVTCTRHAGSVVACGTGNSKQGECPTNAEMNANKRGTTCGGS